MVIIKLQGGLGNQLFQYAFGRSFAIKRNTEFKLDISFYSLKFNGITPRHYHLKDFNIKAGVTGEQGDAKVIKEKSFQFDSSIWDIFDTRGNIYLDGYWQSEKYFIDIKDLILSEISLKNPGQEMLEIDKKIKAENSIALHIRRGDYISDKKTYHFHGTCDNKYYEKAIDYILSTKLIPNPSLYIFSDDIEWVKINFKNRLPIEFVSGDKIKDTEELILMSHCKHNIIANSTFSWWGAWLNTNREKTVIAPQKWFNNEKVNTSDLIPEKWIRI